MKTVIFCHANQGNDRRLSQLLHRNLPRYYRLTALSTEQFAVRGKGKELVMLESDRIPATQLSDTILLFGENYHPKEEQTMVGMPLCIAASDNCELLQKLPKRQAQIITCGMSPKDTFSCSGKNESSASVSLLRQITLPDGRAIEPLEMVFTLKEELSPYHLLAFAALLTLLGDLPDRSNRSLTIE